MLIDDINKKMKYIEEITHNLGEKLDVENYYIEDMGCPHKQPTKLPKGWSAIYIFVYGDEFLKIGKANSNSGPRFISHHYNFSAPSTLAKSICSDDEFVQIGINKDNVKSWMLGNLHRINIYVKSSKATTELIEAILHYAYRPRFEGNI